MDVISAPQDTISIVGRLLLAALLGAAIGLNRELVLKPAGLRTHALVSLGSALAMLTGLHLAQPVGGDSSAPSRVIQGVLAGVGFIGGGVILRRSDALEVHGLTTAASIWIVAATGAAAGAGLWRSAVTAVVLALAVLMIGNPLDRVVRQKRAEASDDG